MKRENLHLNQKSKDFIVRFIKQFIAFVVCSTMLTTCSIRNMAIKSVADALSSGSSIYTTDEDPELVREAVPFGLKLYESLLEETPRHKGLLLASASGFTQYAYAFVEFDADVIEDEDLMRSREMRKRARALYLRARNYAIRGLEVDNPRFFNTLRNDDPKKALVSMKKKDVPFLYWLGASWGAAITISKDNFNLIAELHLVGEVMHRALELDPTFGEGLIYEFFITFDGSRSEAMGGSMERARQHFEQAVKLCSGKRAFPYISLAESVSVQEQNAKEFRMLLRKALEIDVNQAPEYRLENVLMQRRAEWLLKRIEDLFLDPGEDEG